MIDWQGLLSRNASDLGTPALLIDLEAFERNLEKMAAHCRVHNIALRPHAKTHKCAEIAKRRHAVPALGDGDCIDQ